MPQWSPLVGGKPEIRPGLLAVPAGRWGHRDRDNVTRMPPARRRASPRTAPTPLSRPDPGPGPPVQGPGNANLTRKLRGRRPRGVGINCLVALEREAWRIEILTALALPVQPQQYARQTRLEAGPHSGWHAARRRHCTAGADAALRQLRPA